MQFTSATIIAAAAFLANTVSALPSPTSAVSMSANVPQWTLTNLRRSCDDSDRLCTWEFSIDTHVGHPTPCTIAVYAAHGSQASRSGWTGIYCGRFRTQAGYNNDMHFTTMAVVDDSAHRIAYPAYEDAALLGGRYVSPDRSFNVERVPGF